MFNARGGQRGGRAMKGATSAISKKQVRFLEDPLAPQLSVTSTEGPNRS